MNSKGASNKTKIILVIIAVTIICTACFVGWQAYKQENDVNLTVAEPTSQGSLQLHIIDVGQGSAALVKTDKRSILIDVGESVASDQLILYLKSVGVKTIDTVIITHWHSDHYGALSDVLSEFAVGEIIAPKTDSELLSSTSTLKKLNLKIDEGGYVLKSLDQAVTIDLEVGVLEILGPFLENPKNLNDTSLAVRIDVADASFLITGDAQRSAEKKLKENSDVDVDVLVAGHHGSLTSSTTEFLEEVTPLVSAISVGFDNQYGLPKDEIIQRLSAFGPVVRTDINEDIVFETDGKVIHLVPQKGQSADFDAA